MPVRWGAARGRAVARRRSALPLERGRHVAVARSRTRRSTSRRAAAAAGLLVAAPALGAIVAAPAGAGPVAHASGPSGSTGSAGAAVRIDNGAYATSTAQVTLHLTWPAGATSAVVANDTSFDAAGSATPIGPGTTTVPWTLAAAAPVAAGAVPVPDTVSVEFLGGPSGTVTASASVVLDTDAPVLSGATLLPSAKGSKAPLVRVVASAPSSGVSAVELSTRPSGGVIITLSPPSRRGFPQLDTVVSPTSLAHPTEARVRDAAGAWSPWEAVTPEMIAIRQLHGGRLVTAPNNAPLTLRGFDYQPLTASRVAGKVQYANVTFTVGAYRPALAAQAVRQMSALGYDSVRVFLNMNQVGNPKGAGLDGPYLANVANFLQQANNAGIRVLLCTGDLPGAGGYTSKDTAALAGTNAYFLNPSDIAGKERYLRDLVTTLQADGAPLSNVLWELAGEQDWNNNEAPLSWKRGVVRTAAGVFNMGSAAGKAAMENANLTHWVDVLSSELHKMLPGSLVGVGIYSPLINAKRPGWTVRPGPLFAPTSANDFVDIHVYSNLGSQVDQMRAFGAQVTNKVLVMGEFGAARSAFKSPAVGATGEVQWQQASCRFGVKLSGWLLWTWNSGAQAEYWTALDDNGVIAQAMSPKHRPNACA